LSCLDVWIPLQVQSGLPALAAPATSPSLAEACDLAVPLIVGGGGRVDFTWYVQVAFSRDWGRRD
jgi:hypothetical protein